MWDGGDFYPQSRPRRGLGLLIVVVVSVVLWIAIAVGAIELWMLLD